MSDVSLFPDLAPPELAEKLSAGRRLTLRQKADITVGRHPLMVGLALAGNGHTCGDCANRFTADGHNRSYPKCDLHVTGGPASDCRAWWPSCTHWTPVPSTTPGGDA